jgi:predicted transcriptional regulator YheO
MSLNEIEFEKKIKFSNQDHEYMKSYYRLADMVADLIGPHSEVVIHSFENLDSSVVKIVNGHHTGRHVGSPITDMGLRMLQMFLQTGEVNSKSYFTKNKSEQLLKSSTCVIAGEKGRAIGLFCVNINLSVPFPEIIKTLMPNTVQSTLSPESFFSNPHDVINQAVDKAVHEVENDASINKKYKNKSITFLLYENGIFELKESASIVSERLSVSKNVIYKFLREFKKNHQ